MIRFAVPPIGGPQWFGGWMYMCNLVRALARFGDADIETVLFIGNDRQDDPHIAELRGLARARIVVDPAFNIDRVRKGFARTLITGRNDALLDAYANANIDVAFDSATYLGWRAELPSIAWFPDLQHRCLPAMFNRTAWWKREIGFHAQIRSSRAILLSSADAERSTLAFYPAARGRTRVARFSVPVEHWPDARTAADRLHVAGLPQDFVFLPNQLWRHKNHMVAVEAAGLLASRGSTRTILMTGRDEDARRPGYRAEMSNRIAALNAGEHIRFLGSVSHDLVQALTVRANALLNPSLFEGWSTTVEEAKAVGTPLLLSDLPVHREQAPGARFFRPDDAVALADAIEQADVRPVAIAQSDMDRARADAEARQRDFAAALSRIIRDVVAPR